MIDHKYLAKIEKSHMDVKNRVTKKWSLEKTQILILVILHISAR